MTKEEDDNSVINYLLKHTKAYFNEMAKYFSINNVASRNNLFGRILRMERAGILHSDLVKISYGEEKIQIWVKEYRISKMFIKKPRQT